MTATQERFERIAKGHGYKVINPITMDQISGIVLHRVMFHAFRTNEATIRMTGYTGGIDTPVYDTGNIKVTPSRFRILIEIFVK